MSLTMAIDKARMTLIGKGWDADTDCGDGYTEQGDALQDYVDDFTDYDFPDDFDWDALADDLDVQLDDLGELDPDSLEQLNLDLANLANDEAAIYEYMKDKGDSTTMPARIIVTNPPDKLEYNNGDTIDFTGIVVCAYTSATTRTPFIRQAWDGPRHNQVPYDELTFPVTTAEIEEGEIPSDIIVSGCDSIPFVNVGTSCTVYYREDDPMDFTGTANMYAVNVKFSNMDYYQSFFGTSEEFTGPNSYGRYTQDGKTVYVGGYRTWEHVQTQGILGAPYIDLNIRSNYILKIAWYMIYGGYENDTSIPVQWQTDYQTEPYEDTFDITVT